MNWIAHRLTTMLRRSARFVRMICVLSLAIASVLHVVGDVRVGGADARQVAIAAAPDASGTDGAQTAEACHSCSVAPYFSADLAQAMGAAPFEVPEGRLVRMSSAPVTLTGPPPKG